MAGLCGLPRHKELDPPEDEERTRNHKIISFFLFLVGVMAVPAIEGRFMGEWISQWYDNLNKPLYTPPNAVFIPAWTVLYAMIAISAWRVYLKHGLRGAVLRDFLIHLILNYAWIIIFFMYRQILIGLIEICLLWVFVVVVIVKFSRVDKIASYMLIPYLLWSTFAVALNAGYLALNH